MWSGFILIFMMFFRVISLKIYEGAVMDSAIVVEGGGMRGIFAAGVLDAFMDKNYFPFKFSLGVSAGACNLSSHLAGQYQRNLRVYTKLMIDKEFVSIKKYLTGGHLMDIDWLWDAMDSREPVNADSAMSFLESKKCEFRVVVTSIKTGGPLYLVPNSETLSIICKGSSAVPVFYRGSVDIHGFGEILDGGMSDAIPVNYAINRGFKNILVIRSRSADYIKKDGLEKKISSLIYRKYPTLREALNNKSHNYMAAVNKIMKPESDVFIHQIAPENIETGRTTQDIDILKRDYDKGYMAGMEFIDSSNSKKFK
jgi:predicted patatin/cPLA2 family phospholipase